MTRNPVVVVNLLPTALLVLGAVMLWRLFGTVRDALLLLTLATVLAAALNSAATWLQGKLHVPRSVAALLAVLVPLVAFAAAAWLLVPALVAQVSDLTESLPERVRSLQRSLGPLAESFPPLRQLTEPDAINNLGGNLSGSGERIASGALSVLGSLARLLAALIFLVVLVLYMLVKPEPLVQGIIGAIPSRDRDRAKAVVERTLNDLGAWGRSTLVLMLAVGTLNVVGLSIIGVPNALVFGLIAGLGEAVPTVGPIFAAVPPLLATLATDPGKAVWVVVVAVVVQQLENNVLVPLVYGRGVQLHPVSVLAGVLVFGSFLGIVGAFMAVPLLIVIKSVYEGYYLARRDRVGEGEARELLGDPDA
ncbi:MAG TPA: AI-2E family transporter [Deinococcales bacterium]|nr:AI-2E family transporter [Deinococcales bacterium]